MSNDIFFYTGTDFSEFQRNSRWSNTLCAVPLELQRLQHFCALKPQRSKCHVQLKMSGHWRYLIMPSNAVLTLRES